jgi:hypothetical protein
MTSTKEVGRIGTFAFALGAGLLIACGGGAAVASASTGDSDHSTTSSASTASSARDGSSQATPRRSSSPKSSASATSVSASHSAVKSSAANSVSRRLALVSSTTSADETTTATVTASRVVTPQIPGLPTPTEVQQAILSALDGVRRDLTRLFGAVSSAVTTTTTTVQTQVGDVIVGNLDNAKYWANQGYTNTCVLMSTAMVIGQLTGTMPSQQTIVAEAEETPSASDDRTGTYVKAGTQRTRNGMVYQSDQDEYVYYSDALQILYNHKITATATYYTNDQSDRAVSAALERGDSVIVSINSEIRNDAISPRGSYTGGIVTANHAVTVLAVNVTKGLVYINDTALSQSGGNPLEMKLDDFVKAWQPGQYTLITAHLATAEELAQATGPAEFEWAA